MGQASQKVLERGCADSAQGRGTRLGKRKAREVTRRDVVLLLDQVRAPTVQHHRVRALSGADLAVVWPALDTARMAYHTRQALRLILATGQRPGEVAGLPWSELDETNAVWRLPANILPMTRPL